LLAIQGLEGLTRFSVKLKPVIGIIGNRRTQPFVKILAIESGQMLVGAQGNAPDDQLTHG
jgi:hypothetical protein